MSRSRVSLSRWLVCRNSIWTRLQLDINFLPGTGAGMAGLISLPAAVIGIRWLTSSKLSPQICARLFQASREICDLLRVHEFLVLILARMLGRS